MAKANAEATAERVDHLQGMILAGEPNTACLTYARQLVITSLATLGTVLLFGLASHGPAVIDAVPPIN